MACLQDSGCDVQSSQDIPGGERAIIAALLRHQPHVRTRFHRLLKEGVNVVEQGSPVEEVTLLLSYKVSTGLRDLSLYAKHKRS